MIFVEILGFFAGLTNLVSSVPQLLANLRHPERAAFQNGARNACQCAGNAMWLLYGLSAGALAITVFSTLGSAMAATLLWQVWKAQGGRLRWPGGATRGPGPVPMP